MVRPFLLSCASLLLAAATVPAIGQPNRQEALEQFRVETSEVSYRFAFCTELAMDCSCFIQRLFAEKFGRPLPRSTRSQVDDLADYRVPGITRSSQLSEARLCPGDLIYTYDSPSWETGPRHVAVYMGGNRVLHSAVQLHGVGTSELRWVRQFRLKGVYRPLGCENNATQEPRRNPLPLTSERRTIPGRRFPAPRLQVSTSPVKSLIDSLFRSWVKRDVDLFRRCWHRQSVQWYDGKKRQYEEILRHHENLFQNLLAVRETHRFESAEAYGDYALARILFSRRLIFPGNVHIEQTGRESYVLQRTHGVWHILYNEVYDGD